MDGKRTRRGSLAALGSTAVAVGVAGASDDGSVEIERFEFAGGRVIVDDDETATLRVTYRNTYDEERTVFPALTTFRRVTNDSGETDYDPVWWSSSDISAESVDVPANGTVEREYEWSPDPVYDRNATYAAELQVHPADEDEWMSVIDTERVEEAFTVRTEGDCSNADVSLSEATDPVFVVPGDGECEATQSEDDDPWWWNDDWDDDGNSTDDDDDWWDDDWDDDNETDDGDDWWSDDWDDDEDDDWWDDENSTDDDDDGWWE